MKKYFLLCICLFLSLCITLCGCTGENGKYSDLIDAIEKEDFTEAESEFLSLIDEIVSDQRGDVSQNTASAVSEEITADKIKTVGITTENFFDYFYIEKTKVPYIINSKKVGEIQMPAYITLKDKYTIAPKSIDKETHIAIEFSAKNTRRYALADYDTRQITEIYEIADYQNEEPFTDTFTITSDRMSVYTSGLPYGYNVTEQREIHTIFETFEVVRAIGTLYLIEE